MAVRLRRRGGGSGRAVELAGGSGRPVDLAGSASLGLLLPGTVGQQHAGQVHRDGDAALAHVVVAAQSHTDAVTLGQAADHEQTHAASRVGRDVAAVGEALVERRKRVRRHTEPGVLDLDEDAALGGAGSPDGHAAGGRRVRQGVVDDLGEHVDQVRADRRQHVVVRRLVHVDALVLLDLGDGGAHRVGDRERAGATTTGGGAGEDEQGVAVAPHAGCEVVEAEQALQALRVLLVALEALDEGELLLDEGGAATRERLEHVADLDTQACLLTREGQRLLVEVVDGPGELADLLLGVDRDGLERRRLLAVADAADGVGQAVPRDVEGAVAHSPQRHEQRAEQGQDDDEGGEQGQDDQGDVDERLGAVLGGLGPQAGLELGELTVQQRPVCRVAALERAGHDGELLRRHRRLLQVDTAGGVLVDELADVRGVRDGRLVLQAGHEGGLGTDELDGVLRAARVVLVGEVQLLAGHGALGSDGVLQGNQGLHRRHVVEAQLADDGGDDAGGARGLVDRDRQGTRLAGGLANTLAEDQRLLGLGADALGDGGLLEGPVDLLDRAVVGAGGGLQALPAGGARGGEPLHGQVELGHGAQQQRAVGGAREGALLVELGLHAQATEPERQEDRRDQGRGQLAAQRPLGERPRHLGGLVGSRLPWGHSDTFLMGS